MDEFDALLARAVEQARASVSRCRPASPRVAVNRRAVTQVRLLYPAGRGVCD